MKVPDVARIESYLGILKYQRSISLGIVGTLDNIAQGTLVHRLL